MSRDVYASALGLTPTESAILDVLRRAGNFWVSVERLDRATAPVSHLYDHVADGRGLNSIHVHVLNLRKKLGEEAVLSKWGEGYTIGALGISACRRALSGVDVRVQSHGKAVSPKGTADQTTIETHEVTQ